MPEQLLDFALDLAVAAGEGLMRRLGTLSSSDVGYKGRVDLVTVADREAETLVTERILARFPSDGFLAEEGASRASSSGRVWIIDPLDGTTNFVHGFPFFCVSIGIETNGVLEAGVVHAPMLRETFAAERGRGVTLNGRPLRVSETDALERSLLATGFAYDRWERHRTNLPEFGRLTMRSQGVRRIGSAALDLAYVAAGRLDGFWEFGLKPWDLAAGACLVAEAGGVVSDLTGGPDFAKSGEIVASNGRIHAALIDALGEAE